ncbi:PLP-dependent aminotransferase family protein [Actinoplanes sp. NPDC051346]|uniref:MocR-like pyridoxine biosynthesis transcription factor PdxR n=1 Tax=Actinoplanes sp. NPDC051346 TaxID=3155048 RepID=UPI00342D935F
MAWHLQLSVDRGSIRPLHEQLRSGIKQMIEAGTLRPDAPLPSSRRLADDLGLARSVVVEAYQQLSAEGYLVSVDRSGTRVARHALTIASPAARAPQSEEPASTDPPIRWDLRTGLADVSGFPRGEWSMCLQQVLQTATPAHLEYPSLSGVVELRRELAAYLGRVRAARTSADTIMLTAGFAQGLALLCTMLAEMGHTAVAVEDPGHPGQRRFIEGIGLNTVGIPVDAEGLDVEALAASGARAVLLTPANQFPTGAVLSDRRREGLTSWARQVDGLVVEDDYDAEFWFDSPRRPASVQGIDPDHVAYGGSASKTLAPGLRLGWLAVPAHLMPALKRARARQDLGASTLDQLAYAEFIATGRLERHLRRMRKRYHERLTTFVGAVDAHLPELKTSSSVGLHSFLTLPSHLDERSLVKAARRSGVLLHGAEHFTRDRPASPGLVVGYARHTPDALIGAVRALAAAVGTLT